MPPDLPSFPADGQFTPTNQVDTQIKQLGALGLALNLAQKDGLLSAPPESAEEARKPLQNQARIYTIAMRLYLLGYLRKAPKKRKFLQLNPAFKNAVSRFQEDAGLEAVDGWVGDKTWNALDRLVGFESITQEDRWFHQGQPRAALKRAVHLRLWTLGFARKKPTGADVEVPEEALQLFVTVMGFFGVTARPLSADLDRKTIAVLFDQDLMVEKLAQSKASQEQTRGHRAFSYHRPETIPARRASEIATRFVRNMAAIELWLLGYELNLSDLPRLEGRISPRSLRVMRDFQEALENFWREYGDGGRQSAALAKHVTPSFFEILDGLHDADQEEGKVKEDHSEEVAEIFAQNEDIQQTVKSKLHDWGARLWDGMKRLWRWIKKKTKKILEVANNLARAFYRYALKGFRMVKRALEPVITGITFFVNKVVKGSSVESAVISHDGDMDFRVIVNPDANGRVLRELGNSLSRQSRCFVLAARILGFLLSTLKKIVLTGWLGLMQALVRSLKRLKPIYYELRGLILPA